MKKKILFTFLACGLVLITACGKKEENKGNNGSNENPPVVEEQGPIANTEDELISEVTVDGLKFTNVSLVTEGTNSRFSADIVNTNAEAVDVKSFNIMLKDGDGNHVVTLLGSVEKIMQPGDIVPIFATVEMNLIEIKTVEYVRNY